MSCCTVINRRSLSRWQRRTGARRKAARSLGQDGPAIILLNPGSLLGTKMVKEEVGTAGGDIRIGSDIICRAAVSEEFTQASGRYFDNDAGEFGPFHPDTTVSASCDVVMAEIDAVLPSVGQ